jgi:hypothetical protein
LHDPGRSQDLRPRFQGRSDEEVAWKERQLNNYSAVFPTVRHSVQWQEHLKSLLFQHLRG